MCEILRQTFHKAKKEHYCEAAGLIRERINNRDIEEIDRQILSKCGEKIKAGEEYIEKASIDCGSIFSWKSHIECDSLASKYDAWDEC